MSVALSRPARRLLALTACFAFGAWACTSLGALQIFGPTTGTLSITVGEGLDIHMQTVGTGSYASPPAMVGSAVQFLSVSAGPTDPSGISQIFHFKGTTSGTTIISFLNSNASVTGANVVDTVIVQ